jgi:hypothetical protein
MEMAALFVLALSLGLILGYWSAMVRIARLERDLVKALESLTVLKEQVLGLGFEKNRESAKPLE